MVKKSKRKRIFIDLTENPLGDLPPGPSVGGPNFEKQKVFSNSDRSDRSNEKPKDKWSYLSSRESQEFSGPGLRTGLRTGSSDKWERGPQRSQPQTNESKTNYSDESSNWRSGSSVQSKQSEQKINNSEESSDWRKGTVVPKIIKKESTNWRSEDKSKTSVYKPPSRQKKPTGSSESWRS